MARTPLTAPSALLRLEGGALLVGAVALYGARGGAWPLFAALLLAPDLSMLGYRAGPAAGAACYNAAHTTLGPLALGAYGFLTGHPAPALLALIWGAHIGLDRALGYGLKYPDGFAHTHLGRRAVSPAAAGRAAPARQRPVAHPGSGR